MQSKIDQLPRASTVKNLYDLTENEYEFTGEWYNLMGNPVQGSIIAAWGGSGEGKTTFCVKFANYLSSFDRVLFNSVEMGKGKAARMTFKRAGVPEDCRINIVNEDFDTIVKRLNRKGAPKIVVTDSVDYFDMDKEGFQFLARQFPTTMFIFICHGAGRKPELVLSEYIRRKADVKIRIEGFRAFANSRYECSGDMVIYQKGASEYWPDIMIKD